MRSKYMTVRVDEREGRRQCMHACTLCCVRQLEPEMWMRLKYKCKRKKRRQKTEKKLRTDRRWRNKKPYKYQSTRTISGVSGDQEGAEAILMPTTT